MAIHIITEASPSDESLPPQTPTLTQILEAPEDEWQALATLAEADISFCERARARSQALAVKPKPVQKKRRTPRPSRSRRNFQASTVLTRIAPTMAETLDRVNETEAPQ